MNEKNDALDPTLTADNEAVPAEGKDGNNDAPRWQKRSIDHVEAVDNKGRNHGGIDSLGGGRVL